MRVSLTSPCRAGQELIWTYAGSEFSAKLDASGKLVLVVDCFAGASSPVELKLADGSQLSLPVNAADLDRVSKVALIWRGDVDLDLHAFEFAATVGEPGHVWSRAPASLDGVRERSEKTPRGAGYLSTVLSSDTRHDRIEIYTFLHRDGHVTGQIGFAVDHASRGAMPSGDTCGSGARAEIPFRLVSLSRRGQISRTTGQIASGACETGISPAARFTSLGLPPLKIRP